MSKIIKKKKLLFLSLVITFASLQILVVLAIFWMHMGLKPVSVETGFFFSRTNMQLMLLPDNAVIYAARGNEAVVITPIRIAWIVLLSMASALYIITVVVYRITEARRCRIVNPSMIGLGSSTLGSVMSMFVTVFVACCGTPTTILLLPLVGGILVWTLGIVFSAVGFVGVFLQHYI